MSLKNMADWGLHSGNFFLQFCVSYLEKIKSFYPPKLFFKDPLSNTCWLSSTTNELSLKMISSVLKKGNFK
jgi:hypothetical protein